MEWTLKHCVYVHMCVHYPQITPSTLPWEKCLHLKHLIFFCNYYTIEKCSRHKKNNLCVCVCVCVCVCTHTLTWMCMLTHTHTHIFRSICMYVSSVYMCACGWKQMPTEAGRGYQIASNWLSSVVPTWMLRNHLWFLGKHNVLLTAELYLQHQ